MFSKISCHVCSFKAGGQLVAFPFVVLLTFGIFSFFVWIAWLKDLLLFQQVPDGNRGISAQGLSSGGWPEAGQIANSLLHGWTERRVETFGSALVSYCFNGYQKCSKCTSRSHGSGLLYTVSSFGRSEDMRKATCFKKVSPFRGLLCSSIIL